MSLGRSWWAAYRLVPVSLWRHADLILQLTRREVAARYRGSLLGVLWSLVTPFLTLALYAFLFGVVFRARWNVAAPEGQAEFTLILFVASSSTASWRSVWPAHRC